MSDITAVLAEIQAVLEKHNACMEADWDTYTRPHIVLATDEDCVEFWQLTGDTMKKYES